LREVISVSIDQVRIAMISAHSCPVGKLGAKDTGGMSVYIRELAYELGRQGHLVDVYTRVHDPNDRQTYSLGQNARLIHLRAGEDAEIGKLAVYPCLPEFTRNLESFRKRSGLQYDLIFSHYWLSGLAGEYLQQWWHIPHITMFHTLGAVKNNIGIGENEPELRIEVEKVLAQTCHHIIASTENEKEKLIRHYGALSHRIGVVPCGVNLEQFKLIGKEVARRHLGFGNEKIVLFVGRLDSLKGVDKLIEAVRHLQNIQSLKLVLIGGGEHSQREIERLQKLSCALHIQGSVSFLGLVKHKQLPYFYNAADVCVIPSYYESFGLVALESLACGTPVVATDVGSLKSIIRHGESGYVVPDNVPHHLAEKIALVLSELSKNKDSILSVRASVSRFNWPNIAKAVIRECQPVLLNYFAPAV
jgi:D-inositol-3-phosphate glycosyltransferase